MQNYWSRQTADKPLFPDLLWSRPENRTHAGKLLVIGGNAYGFAAPALAFTEASKAGIGSTHVLLPEHVQKLLPKGFFAADFAPSTPSGSFAKNALSEMLAHAQWADGVLLAGDLGRNSETAIALEQFSQKYSGQLTITQDAADYFINNPATVLQRPETTLVISFAQLRRLGIQAKFAKAFTFDMDFFPLIEALHDFTEAHGITLVTKHNDRIFVAHRGEVSDTKLDADMPVWRVHTAAHVATWQAQNPSKPFEASTTAIL
ncbi:MAG: uncharacterized protein JWO41_805 [Candidatus Saccharibacteria bacterium]|nr:uncharacterized protein [Candidatus Saccharibacteria bacterium]